jgi:hydrogenase nickel incorporation protein HypA/HybF
MHEIGIAGELARIVLSEAERNGLPKVTKVSVCFGEMVQVVPDIFRTVFSETVKNTVAEGSLVDIETVKIRVRCRSCGNEFPVSENDFRCNLCNSADVDLIHGNEVFVKSIEGERYGN